MALEALDQPTLDSWLEHASHDQRSATGDFLRWAARRRLAPSPAVTYPEPPEPTIWMSEEHRWTEVRRCLTDSTIPDDVRTAGALLLLLHGLPLNRVIELTRAHLTVDADQPVVTAFSTTIGAPLFSVPPELGRLLARLPAAVTSRGTPLVEPKRDRPAWLFPGRGPAGHVSSSGLAARLRDHGLSVRQSRYAALIGLAADLPAPVISDLFGLSIAASVRWARRAARDWTAYLHLLDQRHREKPSGAVQQPFGID